MQINKHIVRGFQTFAQSSYRNKSNNNTKCIAGHGFAIEK